MSKKKTFEAVDALIARAKELVASHEPPTAAMLKAIHAKLHAAVVRITLKDDSENRLGALKQCKECIKRKLTALEYRQQLPREQEVVQAIAA